MIESVKNVYKDSVKKKKLSKIKSCPHFDCYFLNVSVAFSPIFQIIERISKTNNFSGFSKNLSSKFHEDKKKNKKTKK